LALESGVSGFTILRSVAGFDYPIGESLRSLLPLVDEIVVVTHRGDTAAREAIHALGDARLDVVETDWNEGPSVRGLALARQTNIALERCRGRWALYLQADEVLHEGDYDLVRAALARYDAAYEVDALSFRFLHFEGSYDFVNPLRYRRQCRLVRNDGRLESVVDAAGFGRRDGRRLRTRRSGARIFHYGWTAAPAALKAKTLALARLYHDEAYVARRWAGVPPEDIGSVDLAFRWTGGHPEVMRERMAHQNWQVERQRRPPLDTPLLNPRFYAAWLRKWRLLPRRRWP
jgi:glycosyltransferase involved in cell wall biosynthesis